MRPCAGSRLGWLEDLQQAKAAESSTAPTSAVLAFVVTVTGWSAAMWWRCSRWAWDFHDDWARCWRSDFIRESPAGTGARTTPGCVWMESRNHMRNELLFALVILVVL